MPSDSAWASVTDQLSLGVAWKRVDQVEADAPEMLLRGFQRGKAVARRVGAAEEAKRRVVEALQPEREAVDAGGLEIRKSRRFDRVGIGLERDLDVVAGFQCAAAAAITASTVAGSISDGVPPPKKIEVSVGRAAAAPHGRGRRAVPRATRPDRSSRGHGC